MRSRMYDRLFVIGYLQEGVVRCRWTLVARVEKLRSSKQ